VKVGIVQDRTHERQEFIAEIVGARPAGYFNGALPLLERLADVHCALVELWPRLRAATPGTPASLALSELVCEGMTEQCELAEALHLRPGDRGLSPPRLQ
jgi:hypothetical protein